jgi:hypothetical protein
VANTVYGLTDAAIAAGANVNGAKVQTTQHFGEGASQIGVVAATTVYVLSGLGCRTLSSTILSFSAVINVTLPTGGDFVKVDLKKSTGAGAFATVLSAVITLNSGSTLLVAQAAALSNAALTTGDQLAIVVTTSGTSGVGLGVDLVVRETAG